MTCSAFDKAQGIKLLADAIEVMKEEIHKFKGELQVKVAPRAVDEKDDKALSSLMSTLEAQNQEVDGDATRRTSRAWAAATSTASDECGGPCLEGVIAGRRERGGMLGDEWW